MNAMTTEETRNMSRWLMADIKEAPTERHADRIIASMLRDISVKRLKVFPAIREAFRTSKDGNPRAQQRLADRIEKAGAFHVQLEPGKRGRYTLCIGELVGWNPIMDREISAEETLPEKPWLAVYLTVISNRGRDIKTGPFFFLTHHALSRCAQRFELRTQAECCEVARMIWNGLLESKQTWRDMFNTPPAGHRIRIADDAVAVMVRHASRESLVCATVVWE